MAKRKRVNDMKYHYTYRITNIKERMYYYGVHSCNCLPKEDIGVKYFSSSKNKFVKDQKENPQDYKYKIIKIFSTRVEAVEHEMFLHKKFDVKLHEKFYNNANQTSTGFDTTGKGNYVDENGKTISISREEAKARNLKGATTGKSAWNKGLKMSEEYNKSHKEKIKNSGRSFKGENNPNYGKHHSEETKEKIRQGNIGKTHSEETKEKMSQNRSGEKHWNYGLNHSEETKEKMRKPKSEEGKQNMKDGIKLAGGRAGTKNSFYGKTHSEETKAKIKETKLNQPIKICPHCGNEGRGGNMTRYHFNNCKNRLDLI